MRNLHSDSPPPPPGSPPEPAASPRATAPAQAVTLLTHCDFVPVGDGNFRAVPQRQKRKLTVREATRVANYSRDTIYRLFKAGFVHGERQSPRKILIDADSLQAHLAAVRDPAFWTPSRRARYWSA